MQRGSTRVEKATLWTDGNFDGIEWHVYRMGHLTDNFIGVVRKVTGGWVSTHDKRSPVVSGMYQTRREAIASLCKLDDQK